MPPRSTIPLFCVICDDTVTLRSSVIVPPYSLIVKLPTVPPKAAPLSIVQFGAPPKKLAVSPALGTAPAGPPAQLFGLLQLALTAPNQLKFAGARRVSSCSTRSRALGAPARGPLRDLGGANNKRRRPLLSNCKIGETP